MCAVCHELFSSFLQTFKREGECSVSLHPLQRPWRHPCDPSWPWFYLVTWSYAERGHGQLSSQRPQHSCSVRWAGCWRKSGEPISGSGSSHGIMRRSSWVRVSQGQAMIISETEPLPTLISPPSPNLAEVVLSMQWSLMRSSFIWKSGEFSQKWYLVRFLFRWKFDEFEQKWSLVRPSFGSKYWESALKWSIERDDLSFGGSFFQRFIWMIVVSWLTQVN